MKVAVLGLGAVGSALVRALLGPGASRFRGDVRVWDRRGARARRLRKGAGPRRLVVLRTAEEAFERADLLVLAVSDAALVPLAERLAGGLELIRDRRLCVLHTSGYHGLEALSALRAKGVHVGRLHPLAAIPAAETGALLGAEFGIAGDRAARARAAELVEALRGSHFPLPRSSARTRRYHAAAALYAGGSVALFGLCQAVMADALGSRRNALRAMRSLARSSNLSELAAEKALTGPIARGSRELVAGHLRALRGDRRAAKLYRMLGHQMLELARSRAAFDEGTVREIRALLGEEA